MGKCSGIFGRLESARANTHLYTGLMNYGTEIEGTLETVIAYGASQATPLAIASLIYSM